MTDVHPCPKSGTVKNPALFKIMHQQIHACEGCRWGRAYEAYSDAARLECAHIVPRRMGGATRMDTADNIVMLCRKCHSERGHGRTEESREWMRSLLPNRPDWLRELLEAA